MFLESVFDVIDRPLHKQSSMEDVFIITELKLNVHYFVKQPA